MDAIAGGRMRKRRIEVVYQVYTSKTCLKSSQSKALLGTPRIFICRGYEYNRDIIVMGVARFIRAFHRKYRDKHERPTN